MNALKGVRSINMKQISIIIPMYNSEKTIEGCIDSILLSITDNIEIIVIDDCSIDGCFEICERKYKNKIKLLKNEKNRGPSFSRNKGIEVAEGKYICFVDSDDCVTNDYCVVLLENIKSGSDIYFFDYYKGLRKDIKEEFPSVRNEKVEFLIKYNLFGYSWNKIFKRLLLCDNIKFNETKKYCEDEEFYIRLFEKIQTIEFVNKKLYFYVINDNSLVTKKQSVDVITDIYDFKRSFCIKEGIFNKRTFKKIFSTYNMHILFRINFYRKSNAWKDSKILFWYLSFINKLRFVKYLISSIFKR